MDNKGKSERREMTVLVSGVVVMVDTMTGGPVRRPTNLVALGFCAWRAAEEAEATTLLSGAAFIPFRRSCGL